MSQPRKTVKTVNKGIGKAWSNKNIKIKRWKGKVVRNYSGKKAGTSQNYAEQVKSYN